jgi:hypothetical protein
MGYISQATVYFFDKTNKFEYSHESVLGMDLKSFECSENGDRLIHWKSSENEIKMKFIHEKRKYEIYLNVKLSNDSSIVGEFTLEKEFSKSDELSLVFPLSQENTAYTHKSSPLIVSSGGATFNGKPLDFKDSIVTLDYTHSLELRRTTWNWISLSGKSKNNETFLINLTSKERFLDRENVIWINDEMHFVGDVEIQIYQNYWTVKNDKINLKFKPLNSKNINIYAFLVHSKFSQHIGMYEGKLKLNGKEFEVNGVIGVAEDHYAKW